MKLFIFSNLILLITFTLNIEAFSFQKTLNINIDSYPISLEPPLIKDTNASWIIQNVGERLIDEHFGGEIRGVLAKSWHSSKDRLKWIFKINTSHKFTDGTPVTAEEIVRSINDTIKIGTKARLGHYLKNFNYAKVIDEETITIQLNKPIGKILLLLSDASFTIYKKKCLNSNLVCFSKSDMQLKSVTSNMITLKRFDGLEFNFQVMTANEAIDQLKAGKIHILRNYGLVSYYTIKKAFKNIIEIPDERTFFIALNSQSKKFKSKKNV